MALIVVGLFIGSNILHAPFGFHLVNTIIFILNAVVVFIFARWIFSGGDGLLNGRRRVLS